MSTFHYTTTPHDHHEYIFWDGTHGGKDSIDSWLSSRSQSYKVYDEIHGLGSNRSFDLRLNATYFPIYYMTRLQFNPLNKLVLVHWYSESPGLFVNDSAKISVDNDMCL